MKTPIMELFARGIPEALLFVLAEYLFSRSPFDKRKYLISGVILAILAYLIKLLPIAYGVNTILSLIVLILLTTYVNKIDIIKSIRSAIIIVILLFVCEGINVILIQYVLRKDLNIIFNDARLKIIYGLPSLLIFSFFILLYYLLFIRMKRLKKKCNGETIH